MKIYARTNEISHCNNFQGEGWQEVKECRHWYPSGNRECVQFPDGFVCKVELCEIVQVFDK